ncbi:MAG: cytidylate kinase-like family protein [Tetrasphaera sp.]
MTKPLLTMFEAFGAGAELIGPRLAERLGVPWIGQVLSSGDMEAMDPKGTGRVDVSGFLRSLAFTDQGSVELLESPYVSLAREQAVSVRDLVRDGGVILGRNATVILGDRPAALHVKLEASAGFRIAYAAEHSGISAEQAALRMRREDEARAQISLDVWGWDPRLTAYYDLVINVETFGEDGTVEVILDALERKRQRATATQPA